jgi:hypothetical protein
MLLLFVTFTSITMGEKIGKTNPMQTKCKGFEDRP